MAYKKTKTEHAYQLFHKDLKNGDIPPVIFMYGVEGYLIDWAAGALADKYADKSSMAADFLKLDEIENVNELIEACDTFSIFSTKRIIWAKDFLPLLKKKPKGYGKDELDRLRTYMAGPNPQTILILSCAEADDDIPFVKELKKTVRSYDFCQLDRTQMIAFAQKRFKAAGAEIKDRTLSYFVDETGYYNKETQYRLYNLINDIEKLAAYSGGEQITEEDIDATLRGDLDRFAFGFLDALTSGKKDKAFRMFHNIIKTEDDFYRIYGLIVSQFELMLEAKELRDESADIDRIASMLKANPYRLKKAIVFAERAGTGKIKEILTYLYEVDRNIKTGNMKGDLALELMIGRI